MRKILAGAALALIVSGAGGTAFAGEVNGNGDPTPVARPEVGGRLVASSECAFSGLEDGEEDPTGPSGPGVTQNWGQIPKAVRDAIKPFASPGIACRGNHGG
jgi:hypothetical protein